MNQSLIPASTLRPRPMRAGQTDRLLYDGQCGLCHHAVRFVLKYDYSKIAFRFAPLQSDVARKELPPPWTPEKLPDSLVVITAQQQVLLKSDAALYIAARLGGIWRQLANLGLRVPRVLRDEVYDAIARVRHSFFEKPVEACPVAAPEVRRRFDF